MRLFKSILRRERILLRCPVFSLPTGRLRRSPTAAMRSGRFICRWQRSHRFPSTFRNKITPRWGDFVRYCGGVEIFAPIEVANIFGTPGAAFPTSLFEGGGFTEGEDGGSVLISLGLLVLSKVHSPSQLR